MKNNAHPIGINAYQILLWQHLFFPTVNLLWVIDLSFLSWFTNNLFRVMFDYESIVSGCVQCTILLSLGVIGASSPISAAHFSLFFFVLSMYSTEEYLNSKKDAILWSFISPHDISDNGPFYGKQRSKSVGDHECDKLCTPVVASLLLRFLERLHALADVLNFELFEIWLMVLPDQLKNSMNWVYSYRCNFTKYDIRYKFITVDPRSVKVYWSFREL